MNSLPSTEPIWVAMRLRPLVNHEKGEKHCLSIKDNVVSIEMEDVETIKRFAFDVAMDSTDASSPTYVSQAKCYEIMGKRMLKQMLQGYNTCLFCYGQTGTGKTTTIMGKAHPPAEQGLLMRLIRDIFEEVRKQKESGSEVYLVVQMLEVYNERLNDLLATPTMSYNGQKKKIDVHVHPELGVYLTGAEDCPVQSAEECLQLIEYGNTMKAVSSTAMNASSSRGHTVFKLSMEKKGGSDNLTTRSEVCFADLAGRENERTTQVTGERLAELSFINRSLMWLATCIQSLGGVGSGEGGSGRMRRKTIAGIYPASGERKDMSRFRNSKLTLLLSNALSGNSRTAMIGTLSPAAANFEESFSTLRFASTVKSIKLEAKAATAIDKDSLVRKLEDEVKALRSQLEKAREKEDVEDISDIRSKIEATTAIAAVQARDWDKFQKEAADVSRRRSLTLERLTSFASSYMGSHALPYLANYSEDPHLAFKLVLHVPPDEQERTVGSGQGNDFRLPPSLGICHITAFVRNNGGRLFLRAAFIHQSTLSRRPASIEVNAKKLQQDEIELSHLDCILFGRSTVFYVFMQPTAPEELAKVVSSRRSLEEDQQYGASATQMQQLTSLIIGEERSMDPLESQLAKEYCNQLQSQHLDSEGNAVLRAFMLSARRAKLKVDEANEITESVRPGEGLSFELVGVAPVLSYGFPGTGNLPELSVRLVRRHRLSASRMRWDLLASHRRTLSMEGVVRGALSIPPEEQCVIELLLTWSWPKFISRLDIMHEVREVWLADPSNFTLDPMKDPWKEHGPSELEELCQEHDQKVQELREKARCREKELEELSGSAELQRLREELDLSKARELATAAELQKLRKELEATKAQSKTLITSDEVLRSTTSAPIVTPKAIASAAYRNGSSVATLLQEADAKDRVSRCLELSRANKALLESLSSEQIYGQ